MKGRRDWHRVPKRQKQALAMLIGCALAFTAYAVCVIVLLADPRTGATVRDLVRQFTSFGGPADGAGEDESAAFGTPAFQGGLLPAGADAGEAYLAETVFVGDSNTVRLWMYELVPLENILAFEGIGVESVTDMPCVYFANDRTAYTIYEGAALTKPRRIIMTFGTNDVGEYTCESFIDNYRQAVRALKTAYPYCDILINSIPPVCKETSYPGIDNETIREFNKALLALAEELALPYLDSASALMGKDGCAKPEYWIGDGLHMNKEGLETLLTYVRTHPYETDDRRPEADRAAEKLPRRPAPAWQ